MPPRRANFGFEKRQRELVKQKKKDEKLAKRAARSDEGSPAAPVEGAPPAGGGEKPLAP